MDRPPIGVGLDDHLLASGLPTAVLRGFSGPFAVQGGASSLESGLYEIRLLLGAGPDALTVATCLVAEHRHTVRRALATQLLAAGWDVRGEMGRLSAAAAELSTVEVVVHVDGAERRGMRYAIDAGWVVDLWVPGRAGVVLSAASTTPVPTDLVWQEPRTLLELGMS